MASEAVTYDRKELRALTQAFKAMSDEAVTQAKKESSALAEFASDKIKQAAATRQVSGVAARRIADGVRISKSSKIGEITYGFASQKFSGGATTKTIWGGSEFGSNKYKQFPVWSGREGRGSKGWFIYPTLRRIQPYIVSEWTASFSRILKEWG
jgi:hypothetical protein